MNAFASGKLRHFLVDDIELRSEGPNYSYETAGEMARRFPEARLFWIAEVPSPDVNSAWGHNGTPRSDGAPAVGCDGNLAGGNGNTGATVANKWWSSASHQKSLYRPTFSGSTSGVVICFAMVHGGLPNDGYGFTRAAARWGGC